MTLDSTASTLLSKGSLFQRVSHSHKILPHPTPFCGHSFNWGILIPARSRGTGRKKRRRRRRRKKPEEVVDLSDSLDEFEIFNQTLSFEDVSNEMGVQRKPQSSLIELIENQPGKGASRKSTQSQIPPPLPNLLLLLLTNLNQSDLNMMIQKGKGSREGKMWLRPEEPVRPGKTRPSELRSSKRSATHHNGACRGRKLSLRSHEPGSQHACTAGGP